MVTVSHPRHASESALTTAWFESVQDPMLLCDHSLVVLAANRAATQLLRVSADQLAHRKADLVLVPAPAGPVPCHPLGARLHWRCEFPAAPGERRMLEVLGTPLLDRITGSEGWVLSLHYIEGGQPVPDFIGRSALVQELLSFVSRVAASQATSIVLVGESGTGKEIIAKRLHALSRRAAAPWIPVNCAALPEDLLESELFGYEKGAFTGACDCKEGLMEAADGGTIFLDEIGEMPPSLQAKLLRVLEDHTFRRLGGSRNISVDVRVIAATNTDLEKASAERRFRSDLFYRLNGVQIRVPALRERPEDLAELTDHFLEHFNRVHGREIRDVDPSARLMLERHVWPGNVRELRNMIERAVLVERSPLITTASLAIPSGWNGTARTQAAPGAMTQFSLQSSQKDLITAALAETGGNQTRAATLLEIGRFSLRHKMKKLGMLPTRKPTTAVLLT